MDPNEPLLCKCGHSLDMHGPRGCMAGNNNGRFAKQIECWCGRSQNGVLALFVLPEPSPVSLQPVKEPNVDAILSRFWAMQEHHQAAREEQMRILRERRTQRQGADD
jgi:hypothetical protein